MTLENRKLKYIIPFVILYIIVAFCMLYEEFAYEFAYRNKSYDVDVDTMPAKVAAQDYEKLRLGMTYKEVCDILGCEGEIRAEYGTSTNGITYYVWSGEYNVKNVLRSEVNVGISSESGRAEVIRERNLVHGREVLEAAHLDKNPQVNKTYNEIRAMIKDGMSYEDVVRIMGTKGVLSESYSDISIYSDRKTEMRYAWECLNDDAEKTTGDRISLEFENGKVK